MAMVRGSKGAKGKIRRTPFFPRRGETRRHNEEDRLQKADAPVSAARSRRATLNILMAQYRRRQCNRGRFICTRAKREGRELS
jgi:hypothetical protein